MFRRAISRQPNGLQGGGIEQPTSLGATAPDEGAARTFLAAGQIGVSKGRNHSWLLSLPEPRPSVVRWLGRPTTKTGGTTIGAVRSTTARITNAVGTQSIENSTEFLTPPAHTKRNPTTALKRFTPLWYAVDTRRILPHCAQGKPPRNSNRDMGTLLWHKGQGNCLRYIRMIFTPAVYPPEPPHFQAIAADDTRCSPGVGEFHG